MINHLAEFNKKAVMQLNCVQLEGTGKYFKWRSRVDIYYLGQAFCLLSSMETSSLSDQAEPVMVKDVDLFNVT